MRGAALDALSPDADTQTVVGTDLRGLHIHHPAVRLDNVLDLTVHIDLEYPDGKATDTNSLESQVQHVLNRALANLSECKCAQAAHHSRPAHTPRGMGNGPFQPDENMRETGDKPPN